MALHKPKQLYILGKLRFSSIKPMKMIEIWLKITFIFINGHDFQSGIKSVCDECKNNVFFLYLGKSQFFFDVYVYTFCIWQNKVPVEGKIKKLVPWTE